MTPMTHVYGKKARSVDAALAWGRKLEGCGGDHDGGGIGAFAHLPREATITFVKKRNHWHYAMNLKSCAFYLLCFTLRLAKLREAYGV